MSASTPNKGVSSFQTAWDPWESVKKFMGGRVPASNEKHVSDDLSPRAAKRRRVAEIPLDPAVSAAVGPLFNDPSQGHSRALRVQVLRIGHASQPDPEANGLFRGNGSPVKKDVPFKEIRARCKLTISKFIPKVERRPMYCDSQTCEVKLYRDADGVCRHARIYLQSPFQIPADKLYIERDDTQGFMLADSYLVQTELESAGDGKWPPFELFRGQEQQETEGTPPRQWVLSSIFTYTISKGRLTTAVKLRKSANNEPMTDLMMDTDLRWSTPANMHEPEHQLLRAAEPRPNGVLAPLTNATANGRVEKVFRDIREEDRDMEDEEEGDAEALTPSRSLRMRDKPQNYNLKALSDRARGKELKERKKKKDARGGDAGHVTWILPITRDLETEKWSCIRCNKEHDSIASLKAHLEKHEEYRFTAEYTEQYGWRIVVAQSIPDTPQTSRKTESLEPLSPNHHEHEAQHQSPTRAAKQEQSKPAIVKRARPALTRPAKQNIPDNKHPMYDRLSKVVLQPLTVVDAPPIDNSWLLQKHRDIINDYTDLTPNEKEYITQWDAHVLTHRATVSPHFNDIFLDFIEEKASWLAASQRRMDEALKHLAYLNARNALDNDTIDENLKILREARSQNGRALSQDEDDSPEPEMRSSKAGCRICGQPTPGPRELICSNWDCDHKWHHFDCVENNANTPIHCTEWRCDTCCTKVAA